MKIGYIYLVRNLVNGKGYIGQTSLTVEVRFQQHLKSSRAGSRCPLHAAIRKYGKENFSVVQVASCDVYLLSHLETHFIVAFDTYAPDGKGYNQTLGGEGQNGLKHSEATKAKLSANTKSWIAVNGHPMKGKNHRAESIARMSEMRKGMPGKNLGKKFGPHTQEHRQKISEGNKGKEFTPERRRRISEALKGRAFTPETISKLSESHKGKKASDETRLKMSQARKGKKRAPFSEEWKANIAAAKRRAYAIKKETAGAYIN